MLAAARQRHAGTAAGPPGTWTGRRCRWDRHDHPGQRRDRPDRAARILDRQRIEECDVRGHRTIVEHGLPDAEHDRVHPEVETVEELLAQARRSLFAYR
jgi:hypothetical protein